MSALRHPVKPKAAIGSIDVVVADFYIDCGMELDTGDFSAGKKLAHMNIVNGIAGDVAEDRAQAADDPCLFAVRDGVVAHNVTANRLPGPAELRSSFDGFDVALGGIRRSVVPLVAVFSQRYAAANRVADDIVFNDPALAPVRADNANLLGCRRRPRCCCLAKNESANGDVVDAVLSG